MAGLISKIGEASNVALNLNWTGALGVTMPNEVWKNVVKVDEASKQEIEQGMQSMASTLWQCPLKIEDVTLADPLIAIDSKNIIARRYIAKSNMRGTVKESWAMDDWSIQIDGVLMATEDKSLKTKIDELVNLCHRGKQLKVESKFLAEMFNITNIVIETYAFAHTKGMEAQTYSIKAYSDESYQLTEEI